MRRVQKILEAATHPNTPPAEALAALALFRGIMDKKGGIGILFKTTSVGVDLDPDVNGFGLLGRWGFQRRHQAEIEELRRQVECSRADAENVRAYAQRGFLAESHVRTLEPALANAKAEIIRLRATMAGGQTSEPGAENRDSVSLRERLLRAEALVAEASQIEHERDEARERVLQLASAAADSHHRLEAASAEFANVRSALLLAERERDQARKSLLKRDEANDDCIRQSHGISKELARSGSALRLAEDELGKPNRRIDQLCRVDEENRQHLLGSGQQLAQTRLALQNAEHERGQFKERLAQLNDMEGGHVWRINKIEHQLAHSGTMLRCAERERDEAREQLASLSRVTGDYLQRSNEASELLEKGKQTLRNVERERDGARRKVAELSTSAESYLQRLAVLEDALVHSEGALRLAEQEREETRQSSSRAESEMQVLILERQTQCSRLCELEALVAGREKELDLGRGQRKDAAQRIRQLEAVEASHRKRIDDLTIQIAEIEQARADEALLHRKHIANLEAELGDKLHEARVVTVSLFEERGALKAKHGEAELRAERLASALVAKEAERDEAVKERDNALNTWSELRRSRRDLDAGKGGLGSGGFAVARPVQSSDIGQARRSQPPALGVGSPSSLPCGPQLQRVVDYQEPGSFFGEPATPRRPGPSPLG